MITTIISLLLHSLGVSQGTSPTVGTWTDASPGSSNGVAVVGYDKTVYVSSRNLHCIWGNYKTAAITSEINQATICYSYSENRWFVLQDNGMWHSSHVGNGGHSSSIYSYVPDMDSIFQIAGDASGSNTAEKFLGGWWMFDIAGLSGRYREFSPRVWLGSGTPNGAMGYDEVEQKLVIFPSFTSGGAVATAVCVPSSNACSQPSTTGTRPPDNIDNFNIVFNPDDGLLYAYGGGQANIFTFNTATNVWSQLSTTCVGSSCSGTSPPTRRGSGFAYSTVDGLFLMVGGVDGNFGVGTLFTDTWTFNPSTLVWTELNPAASYPEIITFDRLTYDSDSNVFVLVTQPNGVQVFPLSSPLNYGRLSNSYTPSSGSLNRVPPTDSVQSWARDVAITTNAGNLYAGWIETGTPTGSDPCDLHHPYVRSSLGNGQWANMPTGPMAAACADIDPQNSSNQDGSRLFLSYIDGSLWEIHEKFNASVSSRAWANRWTGSTWSGGEVGCFTATCSASLHQKPEGIIGSSGGPVIALIEWDTTVFVPEGNIRIAQWDGDSWNALGGRLNINTTGTRALAASVSTDGSNPASCWSEEVNDTRANVATTPQIQCAQWDGDSWERFGSSSLNVSSTSWASDPAMAYMSGSFYVTWTERTTAGVSKLYVCRWTGSACESPGSVGALNINSVTGWAAHPSVATDGSSLYVAWEEQDDLGLPAKGYAKRWNGSAWNQVGGAIAIDQTYGSVEGIQIAVSNGSPVVVFGELRFGSLRQAYVRQWNGVSWAADVGKGVQLGGAVSFSGKVVLQ